MVQLLGGLGNQMFQYAFGRALSLRSGAPLLLDKFLLEDHRTGKHKTNRHYELGIFALKPVFAARSEVAAFHPYGAGTPGRILYHIRKRLPGQGSWRGIPVPSQVLRERDFAFDPQIASLPVPRYAAGLWQSWRYFADCDDEIRRDFTFRDPLGPEGEALAARIFDPDAVVVHVRRGDYVNVPEHAQSIGFVGLDYYARALEFIHSKIARPKVFVFSDDLGWCREKLPSLGISVDYVDLKAPGGVQQHAFELQLMSRGRNFVLANSTFSWWAAWLSSADIPLVVVPEKWFNDESIVTTDLPCPDWHRL
ncbi:MAG: alpha-1,2-fucosyltransferase [Pseudomonadota bacterium]